MGTARRPNGDSYDFMVFLANKLSGVYLIEWQEKHKIIGVPMIAPDEDLSPFSLTHNSLQARNLTVFSM